MGDQRSGLLSDMEISNRVTTKGYDKTADGLVSCAARIHVSDLLASLLRVHHTKLQETYIQNVLSLDGHEW